MTSSFFHFKVTPIYHFPYKNDKIAQLSSSPSSLTEEPSSLTEEVAKGPVVASELAFLDTGMGKSRVGKHTKWYRELSRAMGTPTVINMFCAICKFAQFRTVLRK